MEARQALDSVRLLLCASNSEAAQAGFGKYRKILEASAKRWFGCEVRYEFSSGIEGGIGVKSLQLFKS
jgi:hypothetical protein